METGLDGGGGAESFGEEVGGGVAEEGVFEVGEEKAARHGRRRRRPLTRFGAAPAFRNWCDFGLFRGAKCEREGNDVEENDHITHPISMIKEWVNVINEPNRNYYEFS